MCANMYEGGGRGRVCVVCVCVSVTHAANGHTHLVGQLIVQLHEMSVLRHEGDGDKPVGHSRAAIPDSTGKRGGVGGGLA